MANAVNKYRALRLTNLDENLNKNEKLIYGHLILCFNEEKGYSFPTYPELMKVLGVKRRNSVSDAVENLRKKRYIQTQKGYRGQNNYYLLKYITSNESVTSNNNDTSNEIDTRTSNEIDTPLVTETLLNNINNKLNNNLIYTPEEKSYKNKKFAKEKRHKYGEYKHVLLTDEQKEKLIQELGEHKFNYWIKTLDEGIELKGYKYKNHYLAIKKWIAGEKEKNTKTQSSYSPEETRGKILDFKIGE